MLLTAVATFVACDDAPPAAPKETRLLVLDGLQIDLAETAPYVQFLDSFMPEGGRKTKVQRVLDQYLLPMRLAQRAFPAERSSQRERAEALCAVATNIVELKQHTQQLPEYLRQISNLTRVHAQIPVAMFLFDPLRAGSVSPPIEVPSGYFVASCIEMHESPLVYDEYCEALQVGFVTHTGPEWQQWFAGEQARLADRLTFVHPDYRDAMPTWLKLPKLP